MQTAKFSRITFSVCAMCSVLNASAADNLTYFPNGETATPPFLWGTKANWYELEDGASSKTEPVNKTGALPSETQNVYISAKGGVSIENPVMIPKGDTVSVKNLYLATIGGIYGSSLTLDGGILNLSGSLVFASVNYTSGTLTLKNGAAMNVAGEAQLGQNNYTVGHHCRLEIDESSKMDVTGLMTVGRRARCAACVVTNRGELTVGSIVVGPYGDAYAGTGIVHNVGHLTVNANLSVGGHGKGGSGGASADYSLSRGELVLDENSSLQLGGNSIIYVGKDWSPNSWKTSYGDGVLDSSIPIVLKEGQQILIGNSYSNALHGGVLILRKNARLDNSSPDLEVGQQQYGRAKIVMYDNASITNVRRMILSNPSLVHSHIEMHDHSIITNINTIRLGKTTGSRNGSRGYIHLDGNSAIYFTPTNTAGEGSGFLLGTTVNNYADVILKDNALLHGLYSFALSSGDGSYEGHLRMEGGRIEFKPHTSSSRICLTLGSFDNKEDGVGSISGYGVITRTDHDTLDTDDHALTMNMQMHDYSITADGDGQNRDLDFRAIDVVNYIYRAASDDDSGNNLLANLGNLSGTNGWYAVDKGRLIFPRADKCVGRSDANPARHFGDWRYQSTNEFGEAVLPTLVNAFSLEPETTKKGGMAYCHSALYSPDRTDYPANVLRGRKGKVVSVWRIGTCTTGWIADDPITPWKDYTAMKVTFRYDLTAFDGSHPVKLYRHDGTDGGSWRCVASQSLPDRAAVISATVKPGTGTYDLGWFALVEQPSIGSVISIR